MKCDDCENLMDYPIYVLDKEILFGENLYHFEDGYKCTWNGAEGLTKEELIKAGCRRCDDV